MDSHVRRVVVVGGTASGWIAAARLASAFHGTVSVAVLETPQRAAAVSATGQVGALAPELQRGLFDRIGVSEEEWMRACCASFRTAVRYVNWRTEGAAESAVRITGNGGVDHFYRPCADMPRCAELPLSDFWRHRRHGGETAEAYDYACFREPPLMDARKSPRWLDGRTAVPYGWHADVRMFTQYLRKTAMRRFGVRSVHGELLHAERDERGMLTVLHTVEGASVAGDLFLDCTGAESLLLAGVLREPFLDARDRLLCDSAVTVTVPHDDAAHGIDPFTTATAMPDGWAWRMPLPDRFGAGLVHARDRTDPQEAADRLCALWGLRPGHATVRHIAYRTGRSRRAWVKNCVALGSAASFVEPLADEGLADVLHMMDRLVRDFPTRDDAEAPATRFNRAARTRHERSRDFAQLLYFAAPRADTPFWRAQRELPLSDTLAEYLVGHRAGLSPDTAEAPYDALLAALAPGRAAPPAALAHRPAARRAADAEFSRIARQQRILLETLPGAHEYLHRLHTRPVPAVAVTV
ncbi:tryptophan halogenase family protein [Streptomyces netropsis]|uniref:tryptophan halogenase family protein n=1 Tax=Streptomyces netropsis TaxID=55404 RepID=UPI0030D3950E